MRRESVKVGPKKAKKSWSKRGTVSDPTLVKLNRGLDHNSKLPRGVFTRFTQRTHGFPTRKDIAAIRKLPSAPSFERTDASGDDRFSCQCALAGDSLNDEQRSDHLSNPSLQNAICPKT